MSDDNFDQKTATASESNTQLNTHPMNGVTGIWPVPQIIVSFDTGTGLKGAAWGRQTLKRIGYWEALRCFCRSYIYRRERDGPKYKKFLNKHISKMYLDAKFHHQYGNGLDERWVRLQPIGWPEMIDNVVEILVVYER